TGGGALPRGLRRGPGGCAFEIARRLLARGSGRLARGRRRQLHPRAARLRQSYRNGLPGGACAVFPLANVIHFLAHEFACLGAGRLSFALVLARSFYGFLIRQSIPPKRMVQSRIRCPEFYRRLQISLFCSICSI